MVIIFMTFADTSNRHSMVSLVATNIIDIR